MRFLGVIRASPSGGSGRSRQVRSERRSRAHAASESVRKRGQSEEERTRNRRYLEAAALVRVGDSSGRSPQFFSGSEIWVSDRSVVWFRVSIYLKVEKRRSGVRERHLKVERKF